MSTAPVVKASFFEKLTNTVHLDIILKLLGVVLFGLALFKGWHEMSFGVKFLTAAGPVTWYIGDKFNKIYKG